MRRKKLLNGIMLLLAVIMIVSGIQLWRVLRDYHQGEQTYDSLTQYITLPESGQDSEAGDESNDTQTLTERDSMVETAEEGPQVDFDALRAICPDVVGWILIEGTDINYPIVQGKDNNQYLRRMIDGTPNHAGSIFMDSRCSAAMEDGHTIIYGHHMKNRTMFSELESYKQQAFYDEHPWGWLITPEKTMRLWFFAGYVAKTDSAAWTLPLTETERQQWIDRETAQSCFQASIIPKDGAQIVTLSTCSYDFDNARFVLHGVLMP